MLQNLHVKNLALIDEIEMDFTDGLNILTGETGAGKSIIIGSIGLALGAKYAKEILREGTSYGLVELSFSVEQPEILNRLEKLGIFPEDGMVLLQRRFMDKRSVCRVNGETVTVALLKEAAALLIDLHGQHEHQSLLYKKNHLQFLDDYAGEEVLSLKEQVASKYRVCQKLRKELDEASVDETQRVKDLSFHRFELAEIEEAGLKEGEDEELETLYRRMLNGKKLAESLSETYAYTSEDGISRAVRAFLDIRGLDSRAEGLFDQLLTIESLLSDFRHELVSYREENEFSEEEFRDTENRLNEINHLKMKYGRTLADVSDYRDNLLLQIEKLEHYDDYLQDLKERFRQAEIELSDAAEKLSALRKEQAVPMQQEIANSLQDLNFPDVRFEIAFAADGKIGELGMDDVEFMVSLNEGQSVKPLVQVASGGELSRIMLAIKAVLAEKDSIETLIFDEIDVGISGRTAQKVSEKMAHIGRHHQVICITHLAQIAAMADAHYLIQKTVDGGVTTTGIGRLEEEASVQELARILGGVKLTEAVYENAREMKELAKQIKATQSGA